MYDDQLRIVDGRGTYTTVAPPGNRPPAGALSSISKLLTEIKGGEA